MVNLCFQSHDIEIMAKKQRKLTQLHRFATAKCFPPTSKPKRNLFQEYKIFRINKIIAKKDEKQHRFSLVKQFGRLY